MYLKTMTVENVGPISRFQLDLPFEGDKPQPLILVGPNGSGKSTLLSFIVNALIGFKQQAFEQAEVEQNRVYRMRSPLSIRGGSHWYYAKAEFEEGLSMEEWVLDRPKNAFQAEISPLPTNDGWMQLSEDEHTWFDLVPRRNAAFGGRALSRPIQKLFNKNVVLFFPSDRFELPDWLNERSLVAELRFPETVVFQGQTARRIFSRALLKPTLEWLKAVTFDARLFDYTPTQIQVNNSGSDPHIVTGLLPSGGSDSRIFDFVGQVLARVLGADSDRIQFRFSNRNTGTISVEFYRSGRLETVPSLLGLSAGQAALFCIFSNVIRDLDLAGATYTNISDVRGIVILDEADLHLHVDLQYRVLPQLIKLFPRIQFIVTAHSPLFVMGMEAAFGDGFTVIEMPDGIQIESESFTEFDRALDVFTRTRSFDQRLIDRIRSAAKPVVIVEGKSDVAHLSTAWEKLYPGNPMPWDVVSCGSYSPKDDKGSARTLRTLLHASCLNHLERPVLGLFDYDREGMEQIVSLESDGFRPSPKRTHLQHSTLPVHSLVLPVPPGREKFVSSRPKSCFLAIEHYYSDDLLKTFGLADDPVVGDSDVFCISTDSTRKKRLVDALPRLDKSAFANFGLLFDKLAQVLGVSLTLPDTPQAPSAQEQPHYLKIEPVMVQNHECSLFYSFTINSEDSSVIEPISSVAEKGRGEDDDGPAMTT